jgi:predicted RNase H-like nuclease (RuvC/YqgF family)
MSDFTAPEIPEALPDIILEYGELDRRVIPELNRQLNEFKARRTMLAAVLKEQMQTVGLESAGNGGHKITLKKMEVYNCNQENYQECKEFLIKNDLSFLIKEGFDYRSFSKTMREFFKDNDDRPDFISKEVITKISCTKA